MSGTSRGAGGMADRSVWAGGDGILPAGRGAVRAGPGGGRGVTERGDPGLCVAGRVAVTGGAVQPRPGGLSSFHGLGRISRLRPRSGQALKAWHPSTTNRNPRVRSRFRARFRIRRSPGPTCRPCNRSSLKLPSRTPWGRLSIS